MGLINPGPGFMISSNKALLISIAILFTNEHTSKLKIRYTKLRDWVNVSNLRYDKTLKSSMVDEKIDQKEAEEGKRSIITI